jgi:hypothetical protein
MNKDRVPFETTLVLPNSFSEIPNLSQSARLAVFTPQYMDEESNEKSNSDSFHLFKNVKLDRRTAIKPNFISEVKNYPVTHEQENEGSGSSDEPVKQQFDGFPDRSEEIRKRIT